MRLAAFVAALMPLIHAGPAVAGPECQCRYAGRIFEQGEMVCIRVDGRSRMARCEMALNNSSWRFLSDGCPSAEMTPVPPGLPVRSRG